jgi:putative ABC transport system ATP-binding protein
MTNTPIVQLLGVTKSFSPARDDTTPLRRVDFAISAGDKASLIGPSGCGKSTLLSLIAGLLRPSAGTVEINGVAMSDLDDRARAELRASFIGIALQSDNLIPFLTARENVELAHAFSPRRSRRSAPAPSDDLLERFEVAHCAHLRPRQLSGGETQRVALAVAMANKPAVLLADEVVGQLDGDTAKRVISEVLSSESAVLFVTHDVALADQADHRYVLVDGGVVAR